MPKAIIVSPPNGQPGKPGSVYYPLKLIDVAARVPEPGELSVRITAAALNHRDLFIRQHLYPGISFSTPLLADGCGVVVPRDGQEGTHRVVINPGFGWASDPVGPEQQAYFVLGGTSLNDVGTLQEQVIVPEAEVEPAPEHLSDAEAAALPLAGLTAWRALVTKSGNAEPGRNILVTGIGGGVAIMILLFAVALGCNVYVTSSSPAKLQRAKALGAKAGVNYAEDSDWDKQLLVLLPDDRPYIDAVIDGAGGDIVSKTWKMLKHGGVVVSYGMTVKPNLAFPMQAVMKNIEIRGTMMGSRREFHDMVAFVTEKRIKPVVHRTVVGIEDIEAIDGLFEDMKSAQQFGKLVVLLQSPESESAGAGAGAKL